MKPGRGTPEDRELDALLGSRLKNTTPEFDARWAELSRQLGAPAPRRMVWLRPWASAALAAAAAVAVVWWVGRPGGAAPGRAHTEVLEDMAAMDAVLARGTALLDGENRAELLNLPVVAGRKG